MKVLMTGATGLVGREVGKKVALAGHQVFIISRNAKKARMECPFPCEVIEGDLTAEPIRDERLRSIEGVIHLAGESIADRRWNEEKKKRIYDSRVRGTAHLLESLKEVQAPLKVFVSTSASGFYGDRGSEILLESSHQGNDFLSSVCRDWERAVELAEKKEVFPGCRFVILRLGMVLSPFGGALSKMLPVFRWGLGGPLGSGRQWMGWIHIEDLSELYLESLQNSKYFGVINAVAPNNLTNQEFSKKLAEAFSHRLGPAVPKPLLKLLLGEMSQVVLSSQKIEAQVLHRLQFQYQYPNIEGALKHLTSFYRGGGEVFFSEQYIPNSKSEVFGFFSQARNLEAMTPEYLSFQVKSISTAQIEAGTLIDYRLKIHGFPFYWRTKIQEWNPPDQFSDSQIRGPYSKWVHTHTFTSIGKGTLMTDVVLYKVPLGVLGRILSGHLVKRDVKNIFAFRRKTVSELKFSN